MLTAVLLSALAMTAIVALRYFAASGLFGSNPLRDRLSRTDDEYFALHLTDPLADRLAAWLRTHPALQQVPRAELERYVAARIAAVSA